MVINFSQYVEHEDDSKPTLIRMSFGKGHRYSLQEFLLSEFPVFTNILFRALRSHCVCTLVDNGADLDNKIARSIRFTITLKF